MLTIRTAYAEDEDTTLILSFVQESCLLMLSNWNIASIQEIFPGNNVMHLRCEPGEFATGGGFELQTSPEDLGSVSTLSSFPTPSADFFPPTGWTVVVNNDSTETFAGTAYIVCISVQ